MQDLTVALIQYNPIWENTKANLERLEQIIEPVEADLFVLPEMFTTGFTLNAEKVAEEMMGPTMAWMGKKATEKHCSITGSLVIKEKGKFYNRLVWANPFGVVQYYDKKHLFSMAGEHKIYESGNSRMQVLCKGWYICPLICYDLRFPVWSANYGHVNHRQPYDLLLYVASWPKVRIAHWQQLLKARAIENQAYVVGVNRVGVDGNEIAYNGASAAIDFMGNVITEVVEDEQVISVTFSKANMQQWREKFPVGNDAEPYTFIGGNDKPLSTQMFNNLLDDLLNKENSK